MTRTSSRHWRHKPHVTLSDVAVWALFTLLTAAVLLAMCVLLTLLWPATADAHVKTWHQVISMSGGEETYTNQYMSRAFKLRGGKLKLTAQITADPFCVEEDLIDWCWFSLSVQSKDDWWWCEWQMTSAYADGWWTFRLPKGRYHAWPIIANVTWTYTLWEKR